MLELGADYYIQDKYGKTALYYINQISEKNKNRAKLLEIIAKRGSEAAQQPQQELDSVLNDEQNEQKNLDSLDSSQSAINPEYYVKKDIDYSGRHDLHYACTTGPLEKVENLFLEGCNIDIKDAFGNTPLHYACGNGKLDILEFLLEKGADINSKNKKGKTTKDVVNDLDDVSVKTQLLGLIERKERNLNTFNTSFAGVVPVLPIVPENGGGNNSSVIQMTQDDFHVNYNNREDSIIKPINQSKDDMYLLLKYNVVTDRENTQISLR